MVTNARLLAMGVGLSDDDWCLVGYGVALLLVAGWCALCRPNLWLWRWADVIYYPLGAFGVVLLFFSNDINRALLQVEAERTAAEEAWGNRPNLRPDVRFWPAPGVLLSSRYSWFQSVQDLGQACRANAGDNCIAYTQHGEYARSAFAGFQVPATDDKVALAHTEEEFCRRGWDYVDKLVENASYGGTAFGKLKKILSELPKKPVDQDQVRDLIEKSLSQEKIILEKISSPDELRRAEFYLELQLKHATALFFVLSWCADRSPTQAADLKAIDTYQAIENSRAAERGRFEQRIKKIEEERSLTAFQRINRAFKERLWPFVLIFVLAIKFGKAVAAVSADIRNGGSKVAIWVGTRTKKLRFGRKSSMPTPLGHVDKGYPQFD